MLDRLWTRGEAAQDRRESPYGLELATVLQDGVAAVVHVVAASGNAALAYGRCQWRLGAPVVLSVGPSELQARVAWCDERRARLEIMADTTAAQGGVAAQAA